MFSKIFAGCTPLEIAFITLGAFGIALIVVIGGLAFAFVLPCAEDVRWLGVFLAGLSLTAVGWILYRKWYGNK